MSLDVNVTRLVCYFSLFGLLEKSIFAKLGSQFCQILNSYSIYGQKVIKNFLKWRNSAKSGHTVFHIKTCPMTSSLCQSKKFFCMITFFIFWKFPL